MKPWLLFCGPVVLTLAACAGGKVADPGPPRDVKLDQASTAGTQALALEMPNLAVRQYKVALARAYERDDSGAIADSSYNLALAQMSTGDARSALATVQTAEAELQRRRAAVPAELSLVKAAAYYRAGDRGGAATAAQQALDAKALDSDTAWRAWFIRGLVAADQGDRATLGQAAAAIPASRSADIEADRLELQGRVAMFDGQSEAALSAFEKAAANRQQALDYRGMTRALALAGEACAKLGRSADAATFLLRAGRSALLRSDSETALPLLKRAEELARQSGQGSVAEEVARLRREASKAPARL